MTENMQSKKPNNIEELKRLKLAKKEAKKRLNAKPQVEQVAPPKVLEREFAIVPDQDMLTTVLGNVRVMTFNLLAQSLIKRELFPDSGDILKWKPRRKMILDEIKLYDPDILTIQELDNFESYYQEIFTSLGYKVDYYFHPTKRHGCGIAYKSQKFTAVKYSTVDYNTDTTCAPSFMTGNIAQILALQSNAHPNVGFVVGNTHMYWRPTSNYERFRQAVIYSNRFLELKSELPTTMKWIPFLLGDFNTTPDDPVYGILTIGELTNEHIEDLNVSRSLTASASPEEIDSCIEPEEDPTSGEAISIDNLDTVDQLVKKYQKCQWTSIYSNYGKIDQDVNQQGLFGEPKFSNYCSQFKGLLDYMFIDSSVTTSIKRILMPPKEEFMKPSLPNRNFGSDHLCLVADIEY